MIWPIVLLLSIQAIYAAEFPSLMKYITVTWENVDITSTLDGSQTASDASGKVPLFTLCGKYNNTKSKNADCDYSYSYAYPASGGGFISGSGIWQNFYLLLSNYLGDGTSSSAKYLSKTSDTDSCVSFYDFIPDFKSAYSRGTWKVSYNCKLVTPFPFGIVIGVLVGAVLIAGGIFGYKHFQKKKNNANSGQTTYGGIPYMATP